MGAIQAFVGRDQGFRRERVKLSWRGIRAFVGSDSGFRGEGFGLPWGEINHFPPNCVRAFGLSWDSGFRQTDFRARELGFREEEFKLSQGRIQVFVRKDSGFRGAGFWVCGRHSWICFGAGLGGLGWLERLASCWPFACPGNRVRDLPNFCGKANTLGTKKELGSDRAEPGLAGAGLSWAADWEI